MSKVQMLKGETTPPVFCAKLTEIADDIDDIACVVLLNDGKTHVYHTTMNNGAITWLRWVFDQDFRPDEDI